MQRKQTLRRQWRSGDGGAAEGDAAPELADGEKISVRPIEWFADTNHTFSHIFWDMKVYRCLLGSGQEGPGSEWIPFHYKWMDLTEMGQYAFPKVFLGVLRQYAKEQGTKI
nr:NUDIX domain-containing protein [Paenibacillus larvae]